jgi:hypothetical protein
MIIGRKKELKQLERAYKSKEAEFITIYGRRRIGKTYLIREFFSKKDCIFFHTTGMQNGSFNDQRKKFTEALSSTFFHNAPITTLNNWGDLFAILHSEILKTDKKVVIFLDELPWMATNKSKLMQEIAYYWNQHWALLPRVILIVCGSSASWLIKKVIYNKGGLHNRTTLQIKLLPFNLAETDEYLKSRGVHFTHRHVLSIYMTFGGTPYYLKYIESGLSAQQNIQKLIFDKNAPLKDEFNILFDSLFDEANSYKEIIKLIAQKKEGLTRAELSSYVKLTTVGGSLSQRIKELSDAGFIEEYIPWNRERGEYYKVIDEFCLFYIQWIQSAKKMRREKDYWIHQSQRPSYYAWAGYAFEAVCIKHIDHIVDALGITMVRSIGAWRYISRSNKNPGTQIDLIIDRFDDALTVCEIKYTEQPFSLDKHYAAKLEQTLKIFKQQAKIEKLVLLAFVSASGLKDTIYSSKMVTSIATLEDLFKEVS